MILPTAALHAAGAGKPYSFEVLATSDLARGRAGVLDPDATSEVDTNPCDPAFDADLSNRTISATEIFKAHNAICAGNFRVDGPGSVTFRAGSRIVLKNDFAVFAGASFVAEIDPSLSNPQSIHVGSTSDDGPGSLRQAIVGANDIIGPDVIEFDVTGSITPAAGSPLPQITRDHRWHHRTGLCPRRTYCCDRRHQLGIGSRCDYCCRRRQLGIGFRSRHYSRK